MQQDSSLAFLDPRELLLHEDVEPARILALCETLTRERQQREAVLATPTRHGMFVLDGVHRTTALMRLGVPRVAVQVVSPEMVEDLAGWTHSTRHSASRTALAGLAGDGRPCDGPLVATVRRRGAETVVRARGEGLTELMEAFRGVASLYQGSPYTRLAEPAEPGPGETLVAWHVPGLEQLVELTVRVGTLPAGVTRFRVRGGLAAADVSFAELADTSACDA